MSAAWKPVLIVASLLLLLTYLWAQSTSPELERGNRLHDTLRTIELRDAELMRDVLLARAGLLPHYDVLTHTSQELTRLARNLTEALAPATGDAGQALGKPASALIAAVQDKLTLVEYFKSDNALLRNSVTYFNLVSRTFRSSAKPGVAAKVGHLWQTMLSFLENPNPNLSQEIQAALDQLSKTRALPNESQGLITHGRLIVEVLPKLDLLLREIIATPVIIRVDALQVALQQYTQAVEARAKAFRLLLYLVAVILVAYLLYQFARLRSKTLALRRAHAHLQQETAERQQAEIALRESEERLRAITESAHEAIVSADSAGKIVSWNRGATAMFGYPPDEALGTPLLRLMPSQQQPLAEQASDTTHPNNTAIELIGIRQNDNEFPLELSLSNWAHGAERYVTAIMRDISVRKQLQETARQQELKLIQTNKMTALGTLVSGVAHEINNPNQLILMNSGLLADAWGDAQAILEDHYHASGGFLLGGLPYTEMRQALPVLIDDIKDGAARISRIVTDLKDFARPREPDRLALFSLNEVVERAVRLLHHLITRKTTHFKTDLTKPLAFLQGDAQQVEQVVVNLLVNALEALPNRECGVTVATYATIEDHTISLEVRDEGTGIAPEHLEQLCDPFFTTKQASGGTGLGLAITASLLRAHGGRLTFAPTPGKGTCARAIFPEATPNV
ncbi:MAG: PAS domain S-box protein [Methylococcaceae bacterium]|nr:PAS domain S-box protein [Methylococcaceae bacterium]